MENRTEKSILDFTLQARHLRSVYLAAVVANVLHRILGPHGRSEAVVRDPEVALERR